jgi:hypothetical protein
MITAKSEPDLNLKLAADKWRILARCAASNRSPFQAASDVVVEKD